MVLSVHFWLAAAENFRSISSNYCDLVHRPLNVLQQKALYRFIWLSVLCFLANDHFGFTGFSPQTIRRRPIHHKKENRKAIHHIRRNSPQVNLPQSKVRIIHRRDDSSETI
jgi:hypothetical protein